MQKEQIQQQQQQQQQLNQRPIIEIVIAYCSEDLRWMYDGVLNHIPKFYFIRIYVLSKCNQEHKIPQFHKRGKKMNRNNKNNPKKNNNDNDNDNINRRNDHDNSNDDDDDDYDDYDDDDDDDFLEQLVTSAISIERSC